MFSNLVFGCDSIPSSDPVLPSVRLYVYTSVRPSGVVKTVHSSGTGGKGLSKANAGTKENMITNSNGTGGKGLSKAKAGTKEN